MLRNYIIMSWRHMRRHPFFSIINIFGLALGLVAALFIFEYVSHEFRFDTFHEHPENIYRVINERFQGGELIQKGPITYPLVGKTMKDEYPEVVSHTRILPRGAVPVKVDEQVFIQSNVMVVETNFFSFFQFPLLAGEPANCMTEYRSLAISLSAAEKYFGEKAIKDPQALLGKILLIDEDHEPFNITAIFEDIPSYSHLQFEFIISFPTVVRDYGDYVNTSWTWSDFYHYLKLAPKTNIDLLEAKFEDFSQRHFKGSEVSGANEEFYLQPLLDIRLHSNYEYEIAETTNGRAIYAILAIGIFILILAWINYINLTTSRSVERAKEVGIRKVSGAKKIHMIAQFMMESIIVNLFALIIALTSVQLLQPAFNMFIDTPLSLVALFQYPSSLFLSWWGLILFWLVGITLSGFYPAFVLSAYQPISVMKGVFRNSRSGKNLRRGLVIFQFVCSAILITGTLAVQLQLNYMEDQDLGIDISQVLVIQGPEMTYWDSTYISKADAFKRELEEHAHISNVSTSRSVPGDGMGRVFDLQSPSTNPNQNHTARSAHIDFDYMTTFDIDLLAGRNFIPTDHNPDWDLIQSAMINRAGQKLLQFPTPEDAIGKRITFEGGKEWTIVGVLENFHQFSLHNPIEPTVFVPAYSTNGSFSIRYSTDKTAEVIAHAQKVYDSFFPGNAFLYEFLDERFGRQYNRDRNFRNMFILFAGLAIVIACLGLLGLASYTTFHRAKEMSIRKVLGANMAQILILLSQEFLGLIFLSTIIAIPISYLGVKLWISQYSYQMDISLLLFIIPMLLVLFIGLVTIFHQTYKSAQIDPAQALRNE